MRTKLLLSTAALALVLAAPGAYAQQPNGADMKRDPATTQNRANDQRAIPGKSNAAGQSTGQQPAANGHATDSNAEGQPAPRADDRDQARGQGRPDNDKAAAGDNRPPARDADEAKGRDHEQAGRDNDRDNNAAAQNRNAKDGDRDRARSGDNDRAQKDRPTAQEREPTNRPQRAEDANEKRRAEEANGNKRMDRDAKEDHGHVVERRAASLETREKTRLHSAIEKLRVREVTNVNFSVSVGVAVPASVTLQPVPTEIVEVIPEYRGYDFFVVRNEVVIVEPRTHKIVDVIERGGSARAESTTTSRERKLHLTEKQKTLIRQHSSRRTTTGASTRTETRIIEGEPIPQSVEIETFPEEVYREVPEVRSYRYIQRNNDIYIVEPGDRRVIETIR